MPRPAPGREIWILNHYAVPPDRPSGTRHFDFGTELAKRGFRVTIFAAGFDHLTRTEERLGRWQLFRVGKFGDVRFVWVRTVPYHANDSRRVANMLSYAAAVLLVQVRFRRPDHIIGSSVHPLAALAGYVISKLRQSHFYYEVRDLWPQTLIDIGAMAEGSRAARSLRWIERFLMKRAVATITVLPGMARYVDERQLPVSDLVYLPNGVRLANETEESGAQLPARLRELQAAGKFVIGYVGLFGTHNHLALLVEAAGILSRRGAANVHLVLVGDGPDRAPLERLIASQGLTNIELLSPVPKGAVPALLSELDAAVLHVTDSPIYRYGMSFNKLFDYMAAAKPVIFACRTPLDPVREAGAGISVSPNDPEAIASACLTLATLEESERGQMGIRGRRYLEAHHDIGKLTDLLSRTLVGSPESRALR